MHKPPHDLDAEKAIIGVALLDTDRARATDLTADQFYAPAHGHIWHAITQLNGRIDPITLSAQLASNGHTDGQYAVDNLTRLMLDTPAVSLAPRYAALIVEAHQRRTIIHAAAQLTETAYTAPIDTVLAALDGLRQHTTLHAPTGIITVNWDELWADDTDPEDWLIYPLIPRGRSVALFAPAKAGKSTILLAAIAAAVTGQSILGMGTSRPCTVLYLDYEMTAADLTERLASLGYGPQHDLTRLHYALLPSLHPLDTAAGARQLVRHATDIAADLVVVDTFGRAVQGEENEADTTRAFYRHTAMALKAAGIAVIRTDHAGKDTSKGQRGSSAKNDDVDVVWALSRTDTGVILKRTHSRVPWVPTDLTVDQHTTGDLITYRERRGEAYPPGTRELMTTLEQAGIPPTMSARKAAQLLRDAGHRINNDALRAAQRARKQDVRILGETTTQSGEKQLLTAPEVFRRGASEDTSGAVSGALRRTSDDTPQSHTNTDEQFRRGAPARSGAPSEPIPGAPPLYKSGAPGGHPANEEPTTTESDTDGIDWPF
jgi:hypothetical protein